MSRAAPVDRTTASEIADDFETDVEEWMSYVRSVYEAIVENVDFGELMADDDCEVIVMDGVVVVRTVDVWDEYVDFDAEDVYSDWDVDGYAPEVYDYVRYTISLAARECVRPDAPNDLRGSAFLVEME